MATAGTYRVVVMGASAGGMTSLLEILAPLPEGFPIPLLLVQHLHRTDGGRFTEHLASRLALRVTDAMDKEEPEPSHVYVAPANYHLLVERDGTLALSVDARVNWARPSVDVLFKSAARAMADAVIGVILSGANDDGAQGIKLISEFGGRTIAQEPRTAQSPVMPQSAIDAAQIEFVLPPAGIGEMLLKLGGTNAGCEPTIDQVNERER